MCQGKDNFKLVAFYSGYADVSPEIKQITKDMPCDAVILSVSNTIDEPAQSFITKDADQSYDESNEEIYWGVGQLAGHQLFPKTTTGYIGVNNANTITARCSIKKTGSIHRIFFTCFRYEPIREKAHV